MCGRFTIRNTRSHPWIETESGDDEHLLLPRYNIAPSQLVPVIEYSPKDDRVTQIAIWGFHPHWYPTDRKSLINARAETVAEKPLFRSAFNKGRCLVPADGWYEWQAQEKGPKQPYFFHRPDDGLFWFAGIAATGAAGDRTMAILTTGANAISQPVHGRMPVVLADDAAAAAWLEPYAAASTLQDLLGPAPNELIETYPISRAVNKPENDGPELINPL